MPRPAPVMWASGSSAGRCEAHRYMVRGGAERDGVGAGAGKNWICAMGRRPS